MEKLNGASMDIVGDNIEKLKSIFPEIFSEDKIDFNALKAVLGEHIDTENERYSFNWHGKSKARKIAQESSTGTLLPSKDESKDWNNTDNLYIEGDNLEVLKLLQKSYHNKVKMIYIDPPYNTGKDFVYPDNFKDNLKNYLEITGQVGEDGQKLSTNSDTSGRYHSDWLNMMYPRLKLARNLLSDDGVIFISIDDNEVTNLKKICDEIFGEENFVAKLAVQLNPRGRNLDKFIAKTYEYILIYSKNINNETTLFGVEKTGDMLKEYNKEDSNGKYRLTGLRNRNQAFNPITRPTLYYPLFINPLTLEVNTKKTEDFTEETYPITTEGVKTCWTWSKEKVEREKKLLIAEILGEEWRIYRKDYLHNENGKIATTLVKSLWTDKEINNDYGKKSIKHLFESSIMDFPKSPYLIEKLIKTSTKKDALILDFFSGSATTAHATMQLNAEDGGNRKYIMVQLPEPTPDNSEASKAGYKNICEIGKERIRRAGEKVKSDET
ncbi:MAG: site-specific DNA-methyltransferase, partial [Fusobacteriaceae bacterium]